jgi:allophanate hydrolase
MPLSLGIAALRARYAGATLSPVELVREVYRRLSARAQPGVWIHVVPEDEAVARAAALPRDGAGLPLYGIPFAVKDNIDVGGLPTTAACPQFGYVARESAAPVARLLEAGGICIGKTNLDQFATGLSGVRSPYGACASVFNPDYAAGGSSSGSAVAVAAGLVSFAVGTDTGGSGRIPAGFNNVVGLKPTRGWVSNRGVVPNCRTLDCVSVFAPTCADAAHALGVMAGYDGADAFSRCAPAPRARGRAGPTRIGVPRAGDLEFFGDREAAALFADAVARLGAIGAVVEIDLAPFLEAGGLMFGGPWVAERAAGFGAFVAAHPDAVLPVIRDILASARHWSAADAFAAQYRLAELRRITERVWHEIDALAVPTAATAATIAALAADPIALNNRNGHYSYFVNLLDLCAAAVPNGFLSSGVAMGITLVAPAWQDGLVADLGARYEARLGIAPGLGRSAEAP